MKVSLTNPPKWAKDAIATTAGWCSKETGEIYVSCRVLENPIDHVQFIKNIKAGKPPIPDEKATKAKAPVEEVKKVEATKVEKVDEVVKKPVRKPAAKKPVTKKPAIKK